MTISNAHFRWPTFRVDNVTNKPLDWTFDQTTEPEYDTNSAYGELDELVLVPNI